MRTRPDIARVIELQRLLQQFANVDRVVHRDHGKRKRYENDTEHSYNLAMTAWYLAPHFSHLNADLLIRYALVHDLVEVHAGDTYIYGTADELASKPARERAAAQQLSRDWADFPDIHELIEQYEKRATPEACFVYALDKIMPMMLIYLGDGYTWRKEGITLERLHAVKKDKVTLSPEIKPYYDELYQLLIDSPDKIRPC